MYNEMRVTIEDGVNSLVIEVNVESMFDNGNVILNTVLPCFLRTSHPSSSVTVYFSGFLFWEGVVDKLGVQD